MIQAKLADMYVALMSSRSWLSALAEHADDPDREGPKNFARVMRPRLFFMRLSARCG